jgi:hypothetical protein
MLLTILAFISLATVHFVAGDTTTVRMVPACRPAQLTYSLMWTGTIVRPYVYKAPCTKGFDL